MFHESMRGITMARLFASENVLRNPWRGSAPPTIVHDRNTLVASFVVVAITDLVAPTPGTVARLE